MKRSCVLAPLIVAVLLGVAASVASGLMLHRLLQIQQAGLEAAREARAALSGLADRTIETTIPFRHTFPLDARVPVQQEFLVPIQTTIPISTVARVPVEIPLIGTYEIPIPVRAQVPVDLQVVVPVSETLRVETGVEVDAEVPVRVEMSQLGLGGLLERLDAALLQLEAELGWPASSRPEPEE